jgi:hypothetical protein
MVYAIIIVRWDTAASVARRRRTNAVHAVIIAM